MFIHLYYKKMFTNRTSLIIPTKNRSEKIIKLINQITSLNLNFNEILVIDSSEQFHSKKISFECQLKNIKYYRTKSSTSFQRNFGMNNMRKNKYVVFMDDDVILLEDTFAKMNKCIEKFGEDPNIAGFGFNQFEDIKPSFMDNLKSLKIFEYFDIYPSTPGKIARSGWQSKIINLKKDVVGDWIFTTICVYKTENIKKFQFDESFGKYSYLEDLDFSLNLMKNNQKIYISSEAKFLHPENIDRSGFKFGITEVVNRYKIVKKYKLSQKLFFIGIFFRFGLSILKSLLLNKNYFLRSLGNIYSLFILKKQ